MEVELKKLAFTGATDVSVGAFGSSNASATFDGRDWSGQNTGKVSVLIYNDDGSTGSEGNLLLFIYRSCRNQHCVLILIEHYIYFVTCTIFQNTF